jgi:major membrane immunogen (membrane-anchored lipoprotein)
MKNVLSITGATALAFALSACSSQEEMAPKPAPAKVAAPAAPAPAAKAPAVKATKAAGDVGLLDAEKNYMILVTKDGKLVTLDYDAKTKVTKVTPQPAKMTDVGLGSSATVTYTKDGGKNIASQVEYRAKKGE